MRNITFKEAVRYNNGEIPEDLKFCIKTYDFDGENYIYKDVVLQFDESDKKMFLYEKTMQRLAEEQAALERKIDKIKAEKEAQKRKERLAKYIDENFSKLTIRGKLDFIADFLPNSEEFCDDGDVQIMWKCFDEIEKIVMQKENK